MLLTRTVNKIDYISGIAIDGSYDSLLDDEGKSDLQVECSPVELLGRLQ